MKYILLMILLFSIQSIPSKNHIIDLPVPVKIIPEGSSYRFAPYDITVKQGDTITWRTDPNYVKKLETEWNIPQVPFFRLDFGICSDRDNSAYQSGWANAEGVGITGYATFIQKFTIVGNYPYKGVTGTQYSGDFPFSGTIHVTK